MLLLAGERAVPGGLSPTQPASVIPVGAETRAERELAPAPLQRLGRPRSVRVSSVDGCTEPGEKVRARAPAY